jgi:hypothetical protein
MNVFFNLNAIDSLIINQLTSRSNVIDYQEN